MSLPSWVLTDCRWCRGRGRGIDRHYRCEDCDGDGEVKICEGCDEYLKDCVCLCEACGFERADCECEGVEEV